MADYYDHFSFVLPLASTAEAEWWNQVLARLHDAHGRGLPPDPGLDRLLGSIPELEYSSDVGTWWGIETDVTPPSADRPGNAWFRATYGAPNVVALALLVRAFLREFRRSEGYGIETAMTCSKPRADGFGGAAVWITARGICWLSTHGWLERRAARHERRQQRPRRTLAVRAASPASGPDAEGRGEGERGEVNRC